MAGDEKLFDLAEVRTSSVLLLSVKRER